MDHRQALEGRAVTEFADAKFVFVEAVEVVVFHDSKESTLWIECLDEDLPIVRIPARSSCDLGECLVDPLRRSKIREVQLAINSQNEYEFYALKIMSLGEHLGADHQMDPPFVEVEESLFELFEVFNLLSVEALDPFLRKQSLKDFLNFLGAKAPLRECHATAIGTLLRHRLFILAVMACELVLSFIESKRDRAVRTIKLMPAGAALDVVRKTKSVNEDKNLLIAREGLFDRFYGLRDEGPDVVLFIGLVPRVDEFDGRKKSIPSALAHFEELSSRIFLMKLVVALKTRSR